MRMSMRRLTRYTNAFSFSQKFENYIHSVTMYTVYYNWCQTHDACDGYDTGGRS